MNIPRLSFESLKTGAHTLVKARPRLLLTLSVVMLVLAAGIGSAIYAAGAQVTFALVPSGNIPEGVGSAVFEVRLSDPISDTVQVTLATEGGTTPDPATPNVDFTSTTEVITFTAGQTVTTFLVPIIDDSDDEPNENFIVRASNLSVGGSTPVNLGTTEVTSVIEDNESPTFNSITGPTPVNESAGNVPFTISMTPAGGTGTVISPQPVTFDYVVTGVSAGADPSTDIVTSTGTIIIPADTPVGDFTFNLAIFDDAIDELDEDFELQLTGVSNIANLPVNETVSFTIVDDDVPTISFGTSAITVTEDTAVPVTIPFTSTIVPGADVTIQLNVTGGTATEGAASPADFTQQASVTFTAAGGTNQNLDIATVIDDTTFENNETAIFTLGPVTAGEANLGTDPFTLTIENDDTAPTVDIVGPGTVAEGDTGTTSFDFTVNVVGDTALPIDLVYNTADGTTDGDDFTAVTTGTLTIPAGTGTGTITIDVLGDMVFEDDETFDVTLTDATNATIGTASATATIQNDDSAPTVDVVTPGPSLNEGDSGTTDFVFTVNVTGASELPINLTYSTTNVDTDATDLTAITSAPLVLPALASTGTFTVPVNGDLIFEPDETFEVTIANTDASATVGTATSTATILNDDTAPVVSISAPAPTNEGDTGTTPFEFTVTVSGSTELAIDLTYDTADGTTDGDDFTAVTGGTVTIPAGTGTGTITIDVLGDTVFEDDETFDVTLTGATGATIGTATATATILNDDTAPTVDIDTPGPSQNEGDTGTTPFDFPVSVVGSTEVDVVVTYQTTDGTTDGDDFTAVTSDTLTIPAGTGTGTITIDVLGDTVFEDDETFDVTLIGATGATVGTATATATILNDDTEPTVNISAPAPTNEGDSGTTPFVFTVSVVGGSEVPIDINYDTADVDTDAADYTAVTGGLLTIPAGAITGTLTINVTGDTIYEPSEDFQVTLTGATGATVGTATATATILNDDLPTVQFDLASSTVDEGAGTATISVTLDIPVITGDTITVPFSVTGGTAVDPDDYSVATTSPLTFTGGDQTQSITVNIVDDGLDEADTETVELTLGTPTGATLGAQTTHTLSITDNDLPPDVGFTLGDSTVTEGVGTTSIEVSLSAQSGREVQVDYDEVAGGTATSGLDYAPVSGGTLIFAPGETTKTFTVTILEDEIDETSETVFFQLSNEVNAGLTNAGHTLIIDDNDGPPEITFDVATSSVSESAGTATIDVRLTIESSQAITVEFAVDSVASTAVDPTDYTIATASPITFPAGVVEQSITVNVVDNADYQLDRELVIDLLNPSVGTVLGSITEHTLTIEDDDGPTASFSPTTDTVEEASTTVQVTINLDQSIIAGDSPVLDLVLGTGTTAEAGVDFNAPASVTFNASESSASFDIAILNNELDEPNRTLVLTLSPQEGSNINLGTDITFTLTIIDDDETPVANADTYEVNEDNPLAVVAPGVLENDTDADGDTLTAEKLSDPANGTLIFNADGSFTYTPNPNFFGTDTFTYRATDGTNPSGVATVTITVISVNDQPVANDDTVTLVQNTTRPINVLANDTDVDGDALSIDSVTQPANGTVAISGDRQVINYTANPGYVGPDSFEYTVCDNGTPQECDTATVNVTVIKGDVYLPLIISGGAPDLVVESISLQPSRAAFQSGDAVAGNQVEITVVVRNQGNLPADDPFWVDLYINPELPTGQTQPQINQRWDQLCPTGAGLSDPCYYGIVWLVDETLAPGETIILRSTSIAQEFSRWPGYFVSGTDDLYVQVDSWNPGDPLGAVGENVEDNNVASLLDIGVSGANPFLSADDLLTEIPPRPRP
jgi:hypothetical protein